MKKLLLLLMIAATTLFSCTKDVDLIYQKTLDAVTTKEQMSEAFMVQMAKLKLKGEKMLIEDESLRCPRVDVNIDSLFEDGWYVWFQNYDDGTYTEYNQGDVPRVRSNDVRMRCDIKGHGGGRFWLEGSTDTLKKFGISHYPDGTITGMDLYEIYRTNGPHFVMRKDLNVGQGLSFCTAFDGFANEGPQTGKVEAFYRDPEGIYYIATEENTTLVILTLTNSDSTWVNTVNPVAMVWRNQQTEATGFDIDQRCSVSLYRASIHIEVDGFGVQDNEYFGIMRSPYESDNTCGTSSYYILQAGEVQGQFSTL